MESTAGSGGGKAGLVTDRLGLARPTNNETHSPVPLISDGDFTGQQAE